MGAKGQPRTPGSGIKKGYKYAHTLERERTKQAVERGISEHAVKMTLAQIDEARGVEYFVIRRPDGSFVRATDQAQIDAAIAAGGELFKLYRKAPNPAAYRELMIQGFGKPPEVDPPSPTGGASIEYRLNSRSHGSAVYSRAAHLRSNIHMLKPSTNRQTNAPIAAATFT